MVCYGPAMGRIAYFGFCLIATVVILAAFSHFVMWPLAQWLNTEYGWWAVAAIAAIWGACYPAVMQAERKAAIERGLEPPRHLFSRRRPLAKRSERSP